MRHSKYAILFIFSCHKWLLCVDIYSVCIEFNTYLLLPIYEKYIKQFLLYFCSKQTTFILYVILLIFCQNNRKNFTEKMFFASAVDTTLEKNFEV